MKRKLGEERWFVSFPRLWTKSFRLRKLFDWISTLKYIVHCMYNTLLIVQPNISWLKAVFDFSSLMINLYQYMRQDMHPYRAMVWNCQMWKSFSDEIKTMCLKRLDTLLSQLTSGIVLARVCRSTRGGWSTRTNPLIIFIGTVSDLFVLFFGIYNEMGIESRDSPPQIM